MAVRGFDVFDQMVAAAVAPQPAPQAQTVTQTAPAPARTAMHAPDRVLWALAYLLIFAGALLLLAALAAFTPLGAINADIGVPFTAICVGVIAAILWSVVRP